VKAPARSLPPFSRAFPDPAQRQSRIGGGAAGGKAQGLILADQVVASQHAALAGGALEVDVPALDLHALFTLSPDMRTRLLEGLDEIEVTLRHDGAIAAYESRRSSWLPRLDRRAAVR
jgi:hypothetical protein